MSRITSNKGMCRLDRTFVRTLTNRRAYTIGLACSRTDTYRSTSVATVGEHEYKSLQSTEITRSPTQELRQAQWRAVLNEIHRPCRPTRRREHQEKAWKLITGSRAQVARPTKERLRALQKSTSERCNLSWRIPPETTLCRRCSFT